MYFKCQRKANLIGFLLAILFMAFCGIASSAFADSDGDVVILYDQSVSKQPYSPAEITSQWLIPLIHSVTKPAGFVLAGFGDRVYSPVRAFSADARKLQVLRGKLAQSKITGPITDLEAPLRFLAGYEQEIALAVIITDGEPKIWDDQKWSLSKRILADTRYQDLNTRLQALVSQGVAGKARYDRLNRLYSQRNIDFVESRLVDVKEKLGARLVFLDTYGKHDYLQRWADRSEAQYVAVSFSGKSLDLGVFSKAIIAAQQRAAGVDAEVSPEEGAQKGTAPESAGEATLIPPSLPGEKVEEERAQRTGQYVDERQPSSDQEEKEELLPAGEADSSVSFSGQAVDQQVQTQGRQVPLYYLVLAVGLTGIVLVVFFRMREYKSASFATAEKEKEKAVKLHEQNKKLIQELKQTEDAVAQNNKKIASGQKDLAALEKDIAARKTAAEEEIRKTKETALAELTKRERELEALKEQELSKVGRELEEEKKKRFEGLEKDILARRAAVEEELKDKLEALEKDIAARKAAAEEEVRKTKETALAELTKREMELGNLKEQELSKVDRDVEEERKRRLETLEKDIAARKAAVEEEVRKTKETALAELTKRERELEALKEQELSKIKQEIEKEKELRLAELEKEILARRKVVEEEVRKAKETELAELTELEKVEAAKLIEEKEHLTLELTRLSEKLTAQKEAIEQDAEIFRVQELAKLKRGLDEEREKRFAALNEELAARKEALDAELSDLKESLAKKMEAWNQTEAARKQQELEKEIEQEAAASKVRIQEMEREAEEKIVHLLETKYSDRVARYRGEISRLEAQQGRLSSDVELLGKERDDINQELVRLKSEFRQDFEAQKQKMLAELKDRESAQWQEIANQVKQAKEEAVERIWKWEQAEEDRIKKELWARYQQSE